MHLQSPRTQVFSFFFASERIFAKARFSTPDPPIFSLALLLLQHTLQLKIPHHAVELDGFVIGVPGPLEQSITIIKALKGQYKHMKENAEICHQLQEQFRADRIYCLVPSE